MPERHGPARAKRRKATLADVARAAAAASGGGGQESSPAGPAPPGTGS